MSVDDSLDTVPNARATAIFVFHAQVPMRLTRLIGEEMARHAQTPLTCFCITTGVPQNIVLEHLVNQTGRQVDCSDKATHVSTRA